MRCASSLSVVVVTIHIHTHYTHAQRHTSKRAQTNAHTYCYGWWRYLLSVCVELQHSCMWASETDILLLNGKLALFRSAALCIWDFLWDIHWNGAYFECFFLPINISLWESSFFESFIYCSSSDIERQICGTMMQKLLKNDNTWHFQTMNDEEQFDARISTILERLQEWCCE